MSDSEHRWKRSGIDEAARAAFAEGLPASEVWSLLMDVLARSQPCR